jgi:hypothetical protein
MKFGFSFLAYLTFATILSGCTIGNWNICGPQTPAAYCDAKALKELLHPKPYRDLWVKDGASEDAKRLDWLACGGEPDGWWKPTENELKRFQRLDDPHEFFPAYRRAGAEFQRCFLRDARQRAIHSVVR